MINQAALKQIRDSHKANIDQNPTQIIIYRTAMVDDHSGGLTPDAFGTPQPFTVKCRICNEKQGPVMNELKPSGLSTNLGQMILVDYTQTILENDLFDTWKIGPVMPLSKFGGIYGYQAPLIEASTIPVEDS